MNNNFFRHLKQEIALAIPASKEWNILTLKFSSRPARVSGYTYMI